MDKLPLRKSQNIGVSLSSGTKSAKHPLLIEIHQAGNLINPHQILTVGAEYMQVLMTICFIKNYAFLRKLLMIQKCIIEWWCII